MITHAPQEIAAMTQRLARGQVTVADLSLAGAAWDPRLDRSGDWRIDVGEVQWIAARWGMSLRQAAPIDEMQTLGDLATRPALRALFCEANLQGLEISG
jgi:hypothetical protein